MSYLEHYLWLHERELARGRAKINKGLAKQWISMVYITKELHSLE
jgi:hypothetical protein